MQPSPVLSTTEILRLHEELEGKYEDGDAGTFLFGWQCDNPFAADLLGRVRDLRKAVDYVQYSYMEDNIGLQEDVIRLHKEFGEPVPESVFCSASGASAILSTFCAFLARQNIKEVYYLPPIYFSMLNLMRWTGIRARPVSGRHAFEPDFSFNLPDRTTTLIVADPIWYAGIPFPESAIKEIIYWQERTGSLVFVDGSFQYMRWNNRIDEASSRFDPQRTIRLISPAKSLSINGYRFAYALIPANIHKDFTNTYTNIFGSGSADNMVFASEALKEIRSRTLTEALVGQAKKRHSELRQKGRIASSLNATCGYFVFEKLLVTLPLQELRMDGKYFGQPRYLDHVRINLLSPAQHLLG